MATANPIPGQRSGDCWVLIAGGFHRHGGMDRLNLALARYLLQRGGRVHLVCHRADQDLYKHGVPVDVVPRPANSFMLGGFMLARRGREVAQRMTAEFPATRVLVNGGNCTWPDINWIHCVHHAWPRSDSYSPPWFKLKNLCARRLACAQERSALTRARLLIANSERTRDDLLNHFGVAPGRVHVVYPGSDPAFGPACGAQRAAARAWLKKDDRPLVVFAGALGHDSNKGFDVLFKAWQALCARPDWDCALIAAGGGRAVERWKRRTAEAGMEGRIEFTGFTDRIPDLLAAADLLVSPVRYEAYGMNVHEAICCGVPAMVTRTAGVAERYPAELQPLLIDDPEDSEALAVKLLRWRMAMQYWREKVAPFSEALRAYTLEDMAKHIVALCTENSRIEKHLRASPLNPLLADRRLLPSSRPGASSLGARRSDRREAIWPGFE